MGRKPGVPVLYQPAGSLVWWVRFTVDGKRCRQSTGCRDRSDAEETARKLYAAALARKPTARNRRAASANALIQLFGEFVVWAEASGKAKSYTDKFRMHFRAHFDERWNTLLDVTTAAIERYKVERSTEGAKSTTVYKELVTLSRFLRWCRMAGHLHEVPEFERLRPLTDYKPPDLTRAHVLALLALVPDRVTHHNRYPAREFYTVQWAQAMRPGELRMLRWDGVDLKGRTLAMRAVDDKARAGRVIAMAPETHAILSALALAPRADRGLVFGNRDFRFVLGKAAKEANLPHVTAHHLRHARLTELASTTRDVGALQYLAGHKNLATTDRYVRSRTERTTVLFDQHEKGVARERAGRRDSTARRRGR